MSNFEPMLGFVFAIVGIKVWSVWYLDLLRINRFAASRAIRRFLAVFPVLCCFLVAMVLPFYAARDVRDDFAYIFYYILLGATWFGASMLVVPLLGLSVRDDVLERKNVAALWPCLGAMLALTLCYTGANIGQGPGLEAVLASAGLSTGGFFLLWLLFETVNGHATSDAITIGRNSATGIRLAGLLLFNGAVLGAGAAGPWHEGKVMVEFAEFVWPAIIVTIGAASVERSLKRDVRIAHSAAACTLYVAAAIGYIRVAW